MLDWSIMAFQKRLNSTWSMQSYHTASIDLKMTDPTHIIHRPTGVIYRGFQRPKTQHRSCREWTRWVRHVLIDCAVSVTIEPDQLHLVAPEDVNCVIDNSDRLPAHYSRSRHAFNASYFTRGLVCVQPSNAELMVVVRSSQYVYFCDMASIQQVKTNHNIYRW